MRVTFSKSKIKETFLFYYSLFLVILLLATASFGNPNLLYVLIVACVLLFFQPVYIIPVYFISSLANSYFLAGEGLGISRFIGIILIVSGLFYLQKNLNISNRKNIFYIIIITIFIIFSSALSKTGSLDALLLFLQYFTIVIILSQFNNINLELLSKLLLFSSIITILVLGFTLRDNLLTIQDERLSAGDDMNVNRFAMMIAQLGAVLFAGLIIFTKKKIFQLFSLILLLIALFMIILSGSRSALIGIIGAMLIIFVFLLKNYTKKVIGPLLIVVVVGYFFLNGVDQLNIPFIDRFTKEGVNESGGSQERFGIWKELVPITLSNNPIFGNGFGAQNVIALSKEYGFGKPAHNFLVDLFLQTGFFGVTLFFSYFIYIGKKIKKYSSEPLILIPLLILLTALLNGVGETIFPEKLFWNGIALTLLYMNNLKAGIKQQQTLNNI